MQHKRPQNEPNLLKGGRFALGVLTGVLFCLGLGISLGYGGVAVSRGEFLEVFPSLTAIGVALVSVAISFLALREQRSLRQAGTDPVVVVHLGKREDSPVLSTLEISNVGAGAAVDVLVEFIDDISSYYPDRIITEFDSKLHPIRLIPQGRGVSFNFGMGFRLLGDEPIPPIKVKVTYKDINGLSHETLQFLDVRELHLQRADKPPITKIRDEIEKIRREFERLNKGYLSVVSEPREAHKLRRAAEMKDVRRRFEERNQKD